MAPEQLPAPLRRLASFAPSRRARLGAVTGSWRRREADEVFRERLAVQARAVVPEAGVELDAGDADPVDAAALAWLERPDGWQDVVDPGGRRPDAPARRRPPRGPADERADRLQRRLDDATDELKAARQQGTRGARLAPCRQRRAAPQAGGVPRARRRTRSRQPTRCAVRRRRRVRAAPRGAGRGRGRAPAAPRPGRASWSSDSGRPARASDGPRRCRACGRGCCWTPWSTPPRGSGASSRCRPWRARRPTWSPPTRASRAPASSGAASLPVDDPALLDQLLALPRVHLVVDGYNVTKTALARAALDGSATGCSAGWRRSARAPAPS